MTTTLLDDTWTLRKARSGRWAISYAGRAIVLRFRITTCSRSSLYSIITWCRALYPCTPRWPCSVNYNAHTLFFVFLYNSKEIQPI